MKNDVYYWPATERFVVEEYRWTSKVLGDVIRVKDGLSVETIPAGALVPIKDNRELEKRFRRKKREKSFV